MAGRLEGRTAIVTGAGRGIGRRVAMLLAEEGANVVVNDFGVAVDGSAPSSGPAAEVVDAIRSKGGHAVPNFDSVATVEGGEKLAQMALDNFGRLDILINVAGILRDRMIFNMTEQEWDDVIAVHLKGHFCTTKPASILMRQQRYGRIINFSSISGLGGLPGQANYGAAKAGIAGFTRVVARDLGRYGVTCNAISPGAATRMTATVPANTAQLCDEAWNINGKIFYVNGGRIALAHEETAMRQITKGSMWSIDELRELVPSQLMYGLANPAPPPVDLSLPGRPGIAPS